MVSAPDFDTLIRGVQPPDPFDENLRNYIDQEFEVEVMHLPPEEDSILEEALAYHAKVLTTFRRLHARIGQQIKDGKWSIPPSADRILIYTVHMGSCDEKIAGMIGNTQDEVSAQDIKLKRAYAVKVLLWEYAQALYDWGEKDETTEQIRNELKQTHTRLKAYIDSEGKIDTVEQTFSDSIRCGVVGELILSYVMFRSDMYIHQARNFSSMSELAKSTGYSDYHLRTLIRLGEVEGIQTDSGWYGSKESVARYQQKTKQTLNAGAPRRPRS